MATSRTVSDLLHQTATLRPDESVRAAERALARARVTALPVVDAENRLLGTVSQTELDRARSEPSSAQETGELVTDVDAYADLEEAPSSARGTSVSDVMNTSPLTVELDTPVEDLAARMSEAGVHEAPVVREGVLVGVVSVLELVDLIAEGERVAE